MALQDKYEIYTAGFTDSELNVKKHFTQKVNTDKPKHWSFPVLLRKAVSFKNKAYEKLSFLYKKSYFEKKYQTDERKDLSAELEKHEFDLIFANDVSALPLSVKYAKNRKTKIIFDAHEYYPRQFESNPQWIKAKQKYYTYLCAEYLQKADSMFCVSKGIADEYEKIFGVKSHIITNAPDFKELKPNSGTPDKIKLVHHGVPNPGRKIETMLDTFNYLDNRFELDLFYLESKYTTRYVAELKEKYINNKNIHFKGELQYNEILSALNKSYDIGIFLLPFTTINHKYALPNKFFEFVQARLAVAIGPSPEMVSYVKKYDLGIISKDFSAMSMADELNKLTPEKIMHYKNQAHKYAKELSFEKNREIILNEVEKLIGK